MLNVEAIRRQFPILRQTFGGQPLTYLDTAATGQKPAAVLDAMRAFYEQANGNAHRGMHALADAATEALESARATVQGFLHAAHAEEIIFTKNATEAMNLVAQSYGQILGPDDAVAVSILEHHSNLVPWLQLRDRRGVALRWVDCDDQGRLQMSSLQTALADGRVKLLAITAQSNVTGTRPAIGPIAEAAHAAGSLVLVDAAQYVAHHPMDVRGWDCDFLAFSGHKIYGPLGIGVLYGKRDLLRRMPAFLGGGGMVQMVTMNGFTPADLPAKLEAGTQPLAEAAGLAAALRWLTQHAWEDIARHEQSLMAHALEELRKIPGLRIIGPEDPSERSGCVSFAIDAIHPHDLTDVLSQHGICLRAGHHCAEPLHARLGLTATSRLSVGIYTERAEIDRLARAIPQVLARLRG